MRDYTLTWSNGRGSVSSGDYLFDTDERPDLPFEFDALYYDPPTGLSFKVRGDERVSLTEEEIAACRAFCDGFKDNADYAVQAYEAETGLYRGTMLKSEAEAQGLAWFVGDAPDHPVSKLAGGRWERVAALFMEDGQYRLMPDSICPKCVVFLTQAEWDAWPKPTKSTEVWDFATETWKDYRTLERAQATADDYIRNAYSARRAAVMGAVPYAEMATWPMQLAEARAYKADPTAATPFLDAMLSAQTSALEAGDDATLVQAKDALAADILAHDAPDYLAEVGAVHGEMRAWILRVWNAANLDEVDALTAAVAEALGVPPLARPLNGI